MTRLKIISQTDKPRCGLCKKRGRLIQTDCCRNWICNDTDKYVMFSYARNSCYRNHDRYTLCSHHHVEEHSGNWKSCPKCRNSFETEMYVWYGTNEYNFEVLENPPAFKPTKCSKCETIIHLGTDGYTQSGDEYWCEGCGEKEMAEIWRQGPRRPAKSDRSKQDGSL